MKFHLLAVLLVVAAGCGASKPPTDLRLLVSKKAAFDLGCTEPELAITELSSDAGGNMAGSNTQKTFGVDGCGKRASYRAWCTEPMMMDEICDAVQASTPVATPAAPAAPAPPAQESQPPGDASGTP